MEYKEMKKFSPIKASKESGVVMHAYNPSTQDNYNTSLGMS
jgi:hypothetical protein